MSAREPPGDRPIVKWDSKKRLDKEDSRRNKFKERGKNVQRGVSSPALFSEDGKPRTAPKAPLPLNPQEAVTVGQSMGHEFVKKTYFQPTYCHHCTELLWGLKGQGYQCSGKIGVLTCVCWESVQCKLHR